MNFPLLSSGFNKRDIASINKLVSQVGHTAFVEPFFSTENIILSTEPVEFEVIALSDDKSLSFMRAIKDEPKALISCIKKIKHTKESFSSLTESDDYIIDAANSFAKHGMSVNFMGEKFSSSKERYSKLVSMLPDVAKRLKNVNIINRNSIEVINAFNEDYYLCLAIPPSDISLSVRNTMFKSLANYRGKFILIVPSSWNQPEKWLFTERYGDYTRAVLS